MIENIQVKKGEIIDIINIMKYLCFVIVLHMKILTGIK
jgi:hypothetical protein